MQGGDQSGVVSVKIWSPASECPVLADCQPGTVLSLRNVVYDALGKSLTSSDCGCEAASV